MPAAAAVIVVSLAAGIGVNTVVFSWMQAVVLQPIAGVDRASDYYLIEPRTSNGLYPGMSWLEYGDLRDRLRSFHDVIAFRMTPLYIGRPGEVERAYGLLVSGNYFKDLGLQPALGRFIDAGEVVKAGAEPIAVISHDFWQTRFAGAADVIGRTMRVNGRDLSIVGVAPKGFLGTVLRLRFDVFVPATLAPDLLGGTRELERRSARGYAAIARLAPGATAQQAQTEVDATMRDLATMYPEAGAGVGAEVLPFWRAPRGPQRFLAAALGFLQAIMFLLLLTVCGNTANLMLARASSRQREMGVRLALGGSRSRIASLLLAENLVLAFLGAAAGLLVAWWGTESMSVRDLGIAVPVSLETSIDAAGVLFALTLGALSGILFGLAPALQLARVDPQTSLRSGATASGRSLFRQGLMALQVALAVLVLVAAGLFLRGFLQTRQADPGFRREGVLLAAYDLTGRSTNEDDARAFAARLLAKLRALPDVRGAAISSSVPLDIHGLPSRAFTVDGWTRDTPGSEQAISNTVTSGYFEVMQIPIVAGRDFADVMDLEAPAQAIVNEAFVRRYLSRLSLLGGGEPIGRRLQALGRDFTICGVARDSLYNAFGEPPTPAIYFSFRDNPPRGGEIHLRTRDGSETALAPPVRQVVRDLDPELPVFNIRTLSAHVEANLLFRRIPARMFAVLGPMLLVLAAIGIYAVVAYNISQRTVETGVRLALGATRARVVAELVFESMTIVSFGVMAGWLVAFLAAPAILGGGIDTPVFLGVPAILLAVGAVSCWLPARRAARLDPMTALRAE
jgi:putative ABC transport system permease protein